MKAKIPRLSEATFYLHFNCCTNKDSSTALLKFVDPAYEAAYLTSRGITNPFAVLTYEMKHLLNVSTSIDSIDSTLASTSPSQRSLEGILADHLTKKSVHWPLCPLIFMADEARIFCMILNIIEQQLAGPAVKVAPVSYTLKMRNKVLAPVDTDASNNSLPSNFTNLLSSGVLPNEVPWSVINAEASTYYWLYRNIWKIYDEDYAPITGFGPYTFYSVNGTPGYFGYSCKGRAQVMLCIYEQDGQKDG